MRKFKKKKEKKNQLRNDMKFVPKKKKENNKIIKVFKRNAMQEKKWENNEGFSIQEDKKVTLRKIWKRKYSINDCMKVKTELNQWSFDIHIISFKPSFDHLTPHYNLNERLSRSEREWSEIHRYEGMMKKECFWLLPLQVDQRNEDLAGSKYLTVKKKCKWWWRLFNVRSQKNHL